MSRGWRGQGYFTLPTRAALHLNSPVGLKFWLLCLVYPWAPRLTPPFGMHSSKAMIFHLGGCQDGWLQHDFPSLSCSLNLQFPRAWSPSPIILELYAVLTNSNVSSYSCWCGEWYRPNGRSNEALGQWVPSQSKNPLPAKRLGQARLLRFYF